MGHICKGEEIAETKGIRAPFVFQQGQLNPELCDYLAAEWMSVSRADFHLARPLKENRLNVDWYLRPVWHEQTGPVDRHYAYEKVYHGYPTVGKVNMQHEQLGKVDHHSLPPRSRAFLIAMRYSNASLLKDVRDE